MCCMACGALMVEINDLVVTVVVIPGNSLYVDRRDSWLVVSSL